MAKFVITFNLPDFFDEEFLALIPPHRALVNQLIEANIVEAYAISATRTRGWITMNGETPEAVRAIVEQFPLYRFFRRVEIDELFLFDSSTSRFPRVSLN
ncbi:MULTISPECIES: YciI family protein [Hymenobacter]|uniref:Muconolactone isomerase domain-containing protein n=1 Tax=Hymenobacter jejuensis TaxID=2502781 RepID=A0A5B8A382_9BACT|nr:MULTISPECIES: hypothetical protein [Hymenobacter]MBC6989715.1 hypothetical protein [Hymenobacter sp. BT491]QDA61770.1 hypothetical protein FHG12_17450 [Hymenobacter jejuensis]